LYTLQTPSALHRSSDTPNCALRLARVLPVRFNRRSTVICNRLDMDLQSRSPEYGARRCHTETETGTQPNDLYFSRQLKMGGYRRSWFDIAPILIELRNSCQVAIYRFLFRSRASAGAPPSISDSQGFIRRLSGGLVVVVTMYWNRGWPSCSCSRRCNRLNSRW